MSVATGIAMYVVVWWITLFAILPWGNRASDHLVAGQERGAPARPRLWLKVAANTLVAALVWLALWYAIQTGAIDVRAPAPS